MCVAVATPMNQKELYERLLDEFGYEKVFDNNEYFKCSYDDGDPRVMIDPFYSRTFPDVYNFIITAGPSGKETYKCYSNAINKVVSKMNDIFHNKFDELPKIMDSDRQNFHLCMDFELLHDVNPNVFTDHAAISYITQLAANRSSWVTSSINTYGEQNKVIHLKKGDCSYHGYEK